MATTDAPYSIWSPDGSEPNKLKNLLRTMALSIHAAFASVSPSGLISAYAGATAPTGWILCDGSAVSRTTYAALFAAIGTTYGSGDGSTTFNVPNFKGRVPAGLDGSQGEFDTLAKAGGEKAHTLSISEMPNHAHNGLHRYVSRQNYAAGSIDVRVQAMENGLTPSAPGYAQGGGEAHNNLQPYLVVNFIIKA